VTAAGAAAADTYPNRPMRNVVNSGAGAPMDVTPCVVAQQMSQRLGQPIFVENRPGADGQLGIRSVKGMPADGYTTLGTADTQPAIAAYHQGYDIPRHFEGVTSK